MIPKLLKRYRIPERHHDGIIAAYDAEPIGTTADGINAWGVYNAGTRYVTHQYSQQENYNPTEAVELTAALYPMLMM
jgi:hypothetical protein